MKLGLIILAALVAGAFGAHFLLQDPGYVMVQVRGYVLEMSVPGLLLALFLLYLLVRLAVHAARAPRRLGQAAGALRARHARERYAKGLLEVAEGNPARGEKLLSKAARGSDAPALSYLAAARAAHAQGAIGRRDEWLRLAAESGGGPATAVLLTQAELQMDQGEHAEALATLKKLAVRAPNHPRGLLLSARAHRALGQWQDLEDLIPRLARANVAGDEELTAMQREAFAALMRKAADERDPERLEALWKQVPRGLRAQPSMIADYARAAARCGDPDKLEKFLRRALKTAWDADLARIYGEIETSKPVAHLGHAEAWLTRRGEDPDLLLTAARLCMQNQLWGKARSYLETSLAIRPDAATYRVYGKLLEKMGEPDAAAEAFRQGLESATGQPRPPALAGPRRPGPRVR